MQVFGPEHVPPFWHAEVQTSKHPKKDKIRHWKAMGDCRMGYRHVAQVGPLHPETHVQVLGAEQVAPF